MTNAEAPQIPMSRVYKGPDYNVSPMLRSVEDAIDNYNSISTRIEAAEGNRDAALQSWKENTENKRAIQLRATIAKSIQELNDLAEKNVVVETLSEEAKAKLLAEQNTYKTTITKGRKLITDMLSMFATDPEGIKAALDTIGDPTKGTRGRTEGSPGSNLPRVSVDSVVNGGNLKNMHYGTFSQIAMALNVEVAELQDAFAKAAGVSAQDIKSVKKPLTFEFTTQVNDKSTVYTIATTPKKRKERGSSETAESSETEEVKAEESTEAVTETPAVEKSDKSAA